MTPVADDCGESVAVVTVAVADGSGVGELVAAALDEAAEWVSEMVGAAAAAADGRIEAAANARH